MNKLNKLVSPKHKYIYLAGGIVAAGALLLYYL